MLLRPRQTIAVERSLEALHKRGNTLLVAPTGSGKTVMLSAVAGHHLKGDGRVLILQHRDELVDQNRAKFKKIVTAASTGVVNADMKQWDRRATFAMIQTLARDKNLDQMPKQDLIIVDEGHRAPAASYLKVIERAKELNPDTRLFVTTATPGRGDSKSLRDVVDNCADQITLSELIMAGHLVRPRTFVIDIGTQEELKNVKKTAQDFDMGQVEKIMDKVPLTERVVAEWRALANDRRTIVFASTVAHAKHVAQAFASAGHKAAYISGESSDSERASILSRFDRGEVQVLVNCAVLTEGYDSQPVSCVILLRPSSHKSTMIQMIGRGLRTVDPEIYPGITKPDCIVIDFGISVLTHGSLEQDVVLDHRKQRKEGEALKKECPGCLALIPAGSFECPVCGFVFILKDGNVAENVPPEALDDFILTEIDLFRVSPFKWEEIFGGAVLVATAFDAWAMCVLYQGAWHALGACRDTGIRVLAKGERIQAIAAADDYLRNYGDTEHAGKAKRWLSLPVTDKQASEMGLRAEDCLGMTRYQASCILTFKFNERGVKARLIEASGVKRAA